MFKFGIHSLALDGNVAANPGKRRRVRHQHFWRNSDKLPPEHRLYVTSADIKLALEQVRALVFYTNSNETQYTFPGSQRPGRGV